MGFIIPDEECWLAEYQLRFNLLNLSQDTVSGKIENRPELGNSSSCGGQFFFDTANFQINYTY